VPAEINGTITLPVSSGVFTVMVAVPLENLPIPVGFALNTTDVPAGTGFPEVSVNVAVIDVELAIVTIVALAGIPAPSIFAPTKRFEVLAMLEIVEEPLVVFPVNGIVITLLNAEYVVLETAPP
jgi:hypothetical protein